MAGDEQNLPRRQRVLPRAEVMENLPRGALKGRRGGAREVCRGGRATTREEGHQRR
jgi:hypothetical protein